MTETEYEFDLFWHALNYRTAMTSEANDRLGELQACHERIISHKLSAQKEAYAKVCDSTKERVRGGSDVEWQDGYNAACSEKIASIICGTHTDFRGLLFFEIATELKKKDQNFTSSLFIKIANEYGVPSLTDKPRKAE